MDTFSLSLKISRKCPNTRYLTLLRSLVDMGGVQVHLQATTCWPKQANWEHLDSIFVDGQYCMHDRSAGDLLCVASSSVSQLRLDVIYPHQKSVPHGEIHNHKSSVGSRRTLPQQITYNNKSYTINAMKDQTLRECESFIALAT